MPRKIFLRSSRGMIIMVPCNFILCGVYAMENFDAMAAGFDTDQRTGRAKIIADKLHTHIVDGHKKSAIEYGCGTGLVGLQFAKTFKALLLVDSSPEMINQTEQKLGKLEHPAVSTLCCDFMTDTPAELQADYIFSSLVLHHIKDTQTILSRFYDTLHSGGHLLLVDIDKEDGSFHAEHPNFDGHNGFDQSALIGLVLKAGFVAAEAETFYYDSKAAHGKKAPYSLFILDAVK